MTVLVFVLASWLGIMGYSNRDRASPPEPVRDECAVLRDKHGKAVKLTPEMRERSDHYYYYHGR